MSDVPVVVRLSAQKDGSVSAAAQSTTQEFTQAAGAVDKVSTATTRLRDEQGRFVSANKQVTDSVKDMTASLAETSVKIEEVGTKAKAAGSGGLGDFSGALKKVASGLSITIGLAALTKELVNLGKEALQQASNFEQYQQRLEVIGHSASLARAQMAQAVQMASTLPFDVGAVTQATVNLEKFHASASELLPVAANMAAIMGVDLPSAAQALGKAWDGSEGGIREMRDQFGLTNEALREHGAEVGKNGELYVHSQEGMERYHKALKELLGEFDGGAAKQANTFAGQLSNLRDAFVLLGKDIGDQWLPAAKQWVQELTAAARAAREIYDGMHEGTPESKTNNDSRQQQIDRNNKQIRDYEAAGYNVNDNEIRNLAEENRQLKAAMRSGEAQGQADLTKASAEVQPWLRRANAAKGMTPSQINDMLAGEGVQGGVNGLKDTQAQLLERQQAAQDDPTYSKDQAVAIAKQYDQARQSVQDLIDKLGPAADAVGKLTAAGERSKIALDYSKSLKGVTDYKLAIDEVNKSLDTDKKALTANGIGTSADAVERYALDHAATPDSDGMKAAKAFKDDTAAKRAIEKERDDEAARKKREADEQLRKTNEEGLKTLNDGIATQKDALKQQLDENLISLTEYAAKLRDLAKTVRATGQAMGPTDLEGQGVLKTAAGIDLLAAQADKEQRAKVERDQERADRATLSDADKDLERGIHTNERRIGGVDKNDIAAQQADLDAEVALVQANEAKKLSVHSLTEEQIREIHASAAAKLEQIDDERLAKVEANAKREEQAHERAEAAVLRINDLQLKHDEKLGDPAKVAQDLRNQLDLRLSLIEEQKQREIAATGDAATATIVAEAAKQEAIQQTSDTLDQLIAKQDKAAGNTSSLNPGAITGPMSSAQGIDYLNKGTESDWYGAGSGLEQFKIGGSSPAAAANDPYSQLKAALDTPATQLTSAGTQLQAAAAALTASASKTQTTIPSGPAGVPPLGAANAPANAYTKTPSGEFVPSTNLAGGGDTSQVTGYSGGQYEVYKGKLIDHNTGAVNPNAATDTGGPGKGATVINVQGSIIDTQGLMQAIQAHKDQSDMTSAGVLPTV